MRIEVPYLLTKRFSSESVVSDSCLSISVARSASCSLFPSSSGYHSQPVPSIDMKRSHPEDPQKERKSNTTNRAPPPPYQNSASKTVQQELPTYTASDLRDNAANAADKEIVLSAVHNYGLALKYASKELQSDREVVLAAVNKNGCALEFASKELRSDRKIVLAAVNKNGCALEFASKGLRSDREVVLAAVKSSGFALKYAPTELQSDRALVLAAVNSCGFALQYASTELQSDREIVLAAVNDTPSSLAFASEELRSDQEVVLAAVNNDGYALKHASKELRSDRDFVLAAVNNWGCALKWASEELRSDRDVVLAALNNYGEALRFASQELRSDPVVVLAAVKNAARNALPYANGDLFNCATNESIRFVLTTLQTLQENHPGCFDCAHYNEFWRIFRSLEVVLIGLYQELKATGLDFVNAGNVILFARAWVTRTQATPKYLSLVCRNATVAIDTQRTIEEFIHVPGEEQAAIRLLTYSHIIQSVTEVLCPAHSAGSNWWQLLHNLAYYNSY